MELEARLTWLQDDMVVRRGLTHRPQPQPWPHCCAATGQGVQVAPCHPSSLEKLATLQRIPWVLGPALASEGSQLLSAPCSGELGGGLALTSE